jgi:lipopolysaccharide export system permease protein
MESGNLPKTDSTFAALAADQQRNATKEAARQAQNVVNDLSMKSDYAKYLNRQERMHVIEAIGKFTLALSCIIFFFIGAPLGAIIRKGGLGVPVIISVIVFIVYYIFENSGMRMARDDNWTIWFGKGISTMVLAPLAVFFTYKANSDSTVFNFDAYRLLFMRMFGMRQKRNVVRKEVIINGPDYAGDAAALLTINTEIDAYHQEHNLQWLPNPIKVFFRPGDDQRIQDISDRLEIIIEDLGNTRDRIILHELNNYPILATHAHTRPFRRRWLNALTGLILPLGLFFYLRMIRFRRRLDKDLKTIEKTSNKIIERIEEL